MDALLRKRVLHLGGIVGVIFSLLGFAQSCPGAEMVRIPAGAFQMGDHHGEGDAAERPVHSVYVSAFYMDKYEVTRALWDEVYNWAVGHGYGFDNAGSGSDGDHPVRSVNWYDCAKWCNAWNEMEGLPLCHTVGGSPYRTGQNSPECNWSGSGY